MTHRFSARRATFSLCLVALALSACGGGGTTSTAQTTIQGAVVKGPVAASTVCAYAVQANARSASLGSCVTTDANGNYTLTLTTDVGQVVWLEASGGTYTDEATGTPATLPSDSPLRTIVTANSGSVSSMLTPLTTLALNTAAATVGSTGSLNAGAFNAAATQLLSTFNLPADLDIATTLPAFGSGLNAYGAALATISQMVANGTTLGTILATSQPSALAAAYATAAESPVTPPVTGSSPTASGTLTVTGAAPDGASSTFVPDATAFEVAVTENTTTYTFTKLTSASPNYARVVVTVALLGNTTVSYTDQIGGRTSHVFCASACGVSISTPSGSTHPVTLTFDATPLPANAATGARTLTGSLTGDAPGAAWRQADLPGSITSTLTLNGADVQVLSISDSTTDAGTTILRSIVLRLSDGSQLVLSRNGADAVTATRIVPPASLASCASACGITLSDTSTETLLTFSNTNLGGSTVLQGSLGFAKTSGTLSSSDAGSFTPTASSIASLNNKRTLTFNVLGTAAQAGLSLLTVEVQDGRVISAAATVGIASQVMHCFDNGSGIGVPPCTGISVAADGRTVTFSNAVLYGGAFGVPKRNVTFNGTVVAKGP